MATQKGFMHKVKSISRTYREKVAEEQRQEQEAQTQREFEERKKKQEERKRQVEQARQELEKILEAGQPFVYVGQLENWNKLTKRAIYKTPIGNDAINEVPIFIAKAVLANGEGQGFEEVEKQLRLAAKQWNEEWGKKDENYALLHVCREYLILSGSNENIDKVGELFLSYHKSLQNDTNLSEVRRMGWGDEIKKNQDFIEAIKERNTSLLPEATDKRIEQCEKACAKGIELVHPQAVDFLTNLEDDILAEISTERGVLRAKEFCGIIEALQAQEQGKSVQEIGEILKKANKNVNQNYFDKLYEIDGDFSAYDKFLELSKDGVEIYQTLVVDRLEKDMVDCKKFGLFENEAKVQKQLKEANERIERIEKRNTQKQQTEEMEL